MSTQVDNKRAQPVAPERRRLLVAIAIGVLGLYSVFEIADSRSAARRLSLARADLDEVKVKLAEIDRLKTAPRVAALSIESPAEITNRISAARQKAGLPQSSLIREQPQAPQRIGRTDFELRLTTIQLAPSTLPQILAFCESLRDQQTGSLVRDLRITPSQNGAGPAGQETWEAEMILTQMIFSPKSR